MPSTHGVFRDRRPGALCSDGSPHLNQRLTRHLGLSEAIITRQEEKARTSS